MKELALLVSLPFLTVIGIVLDLAVPVAAFIIIYMFCTKEKKFSPTKGYSDLEILVQKQAEEIQALKTQVAQYEGNLEA